MTPQDALILLDKAVSLIQADRGTHIQYQEAVRVLNEVVFPPKIEELVAPEPTEAEEVAIST